MWFLPKSAAPSYDFFFKHLHDVRFNNFGVTGGPEVEDSNTLREASGYKSFQDLRTTSLAS